MPLSCRCFCFLIALRLCNISSTVPKASGPTISAARKPILS